MNEARIALLKQYIEEEPNDPFNHYALANEYLLPMPEKARECFDFLVEYHPDYLPTYFLAAQLYKDFEDYNVAENLYKKGIALAKQLGDDKALRELSTAYQNLLFEMD